MKDTAFKLLVIMMQPVGTLENTSEYMKSYFNSRTYLDVNDLSLFDKIANYLSWVKQSKDKKPNEDMLEEGNNDDFELVERFVKNA